MGVHGLWKLLEPVGKVVPLEGMAGKVLAVDVSIWLHQAIKGMHDTHGAPIAIAHLLILFRRVCKLLFYKIKPVFVFDGGVPALKRETMATRRYQRTSAKNEATKVREKLFKNLLKHEAVRQMLSHGNSSELLGLSSLALPGSSVEEELYKLPPITEKPNEDRSDEEVSTGEDDGEMKYTEDIHSIDVTSSDFKSLPPEVRHEILLELIETRKQNSWKSIDSMPKESDSFSDFQMNRLLKRRAVQSSLDEAGKEMGGASLTMKELENLLLNDPLTLENEDFLPSKRIAQSDDARFLLLQKDDEVLSENWAEKVKNEIDKEPTGYITEDQNSGMFEPVETLKEIKQEELSQEEIYDLIKKENPSKVTIKLTKDRKMNLTDDVMEILPMLGEKDGKMMFEDISGLLAPNKITLEKEEVESTVKDEQDKPECPSQSVVTTEDNKIKFEAPTIDVGKIPETKNPRIQNSADGWRQVEEGGNNQHGKLQFPPEALVTVEANKKETEVSVIHAKENPETNIQLLQDSVDLSEESEDDFVPVKTAESEDIVFSKVNAVTVPIVKKNNTNEIEIIINTEKGKTESDDIFSDVFEPEKVQSKEEVIEKRSTETKEVDMEQVENNAESEDFNILKTEMTDRDLQELKKTVEGECDDLMQEQWRKERYAQSISEQMNLDAQELLRLFGVPYVVAPMEAEAQCAILDLIGLTDGTITDDSDIWLFGGKVVYRNFFNQKKHVQQYRNEDIERYFKLSREDLIKLAMLVGSDYTSGLEGVGPVTALEILGAFPSSKNGDIMSGLMSFREWMSSGSDIDPTRRTLRRKIKNTRIIPGFPSEAVVEAYMHPQVDDSKEPFSWSKPNVPLLQQYAKIKFGWNQERSDELLIPVIRKMNENKSNTTIEKYFKVMEKEAFVEGTLSKRVENALRRIRNKESASGSNEADESEPEEKKRKTRKKSYQNPSTTKDGLSQTKDTQECIPQRRAMELTLEDRKRAAIQIFKRTKRNSVKRKVKTVIKQEVDLSESSSSSS